jgi:hypothetical protein
MAAGTIETWGTWAQKICVATKINATPTAICAAYYKAVVVACKNSRVGLEATATGAYGQPKTNLGRACCREEVSKARGCLPTFT